MIPVFKGDFHSVESIEKQFSRPGCLKGCQVIWADYETHSYDGTAFVIYRDPQGQLREVHSSHCSCDGLEWGTEGEPTTVEAILMRPDLDRELVLILTLMNLGERLTELEESAKSKSLANEILRSIP